MCSSDLPLRDAAIWQIRLIEVSATLSDRAFCAWLRLPVNADAFGRVSEAWALAGESLLQSRRTLDEAGRGVERAIPRFSFRRIMALVACVLLAIGVGITVQQNIGTRIYATGPGGVEVVRLDYGSQYWLDANTALHVG